MYESKTNTYRIDKSCNGLKDKPLRVHLQGVLMSSLNAVEDLLLVTVHSGILQRKQRIKHAMHYVYEARYMSCSNASNVICRAFQIRFNMTN